MTVQEEYAIETSNIRHKIWHVFKDIKLTKADISHRRDDLIPTFDEAFLMSTPVDEVIDYGRGVCVKRLKNRMTGVYVFVINMTKGSELKRHINTLDRSLYVLSGEIYETQRNQTYQKDEELFVQANKSSAFIAREESVLLSILM